MTKVNLRTLTKLDACEYGKRWFLNNIGELDVSKIPEIEGDYNGYIDWLKKKYVNITYDEKGNELTYKNGNGYS